MERHIHVNIAATFATRTNCSTTFRGRNGAQGCIEAIKKGVQQDIKMARVGMHFGYFGHALCRSSKKLLLNLVMI